MLQADSTAARRNGKLTQVNFCAMQHRPECPDPGSPTPPRQAEGIASSVMQTTRHVDGPGTSASPERGKQLWDD